MNILKHGTMTVAVGGFSERAISYLPLIGDFLGRQILELTKISVGLPFAITLMTSVASKAINNWIDRCYFNGPIRTEFCLKREVIHLAVTVLTGAVASLISAWLVGGSQVIISSALISGICIGTLIYTVLKIVDVVSFIKKFFFQEEIVTFIEECFEAVETSKETNTYISIKIDRNDDRLTLVDYLNDPQGYGYAWVASKIEPHKERIIYANSNQGFIAVKPLVLKILEKEIYRLEKILNRYSSINNYNTILRDRMHRKTASEVIKAVESRLTILYNAYENWKDVGTQVIYGVDKKKEERMFFNINKEEIESSFKSR